MGDGPELSRPPVVAMIGMATLDYLYVLDDYPAADSVTPALEHQIAVGGLAGRGAIAAKRLGAPPGCWRRAGPACMPRS